MSELTDIELWSQSAEAWVIGNGETGDYSRRFLDPFVWQELGDLTGKDVIDIGCGEGRFARAIAAKGAQVTAIDPTAALLTHAKQKGGPVNYLLGSATALPIETESFDWAIFYLVLIDIDTYQKAILEATRVLKPGGKLLVVNVTSMATATNEPLWERDESGKKLARRVEFYGQETSVLCEWKGIKIRNYHRPLSAYMKAFLAAGLQLIHFDEPLPSPQQIEQDPKLNDFVIAPNFNLMVWMKR